MKGISEGAVRPKDVASFERGLGGGRNGQIKASRCRFPIVLDLALYSPYKFKVMHDELNSYCGDGVRLEGKLKFKGALRFEGSFKGEIETSDTLIVGPSGKVEAKVEAGALYNMGEIVGNIRGAKRISILAGSKLNGNIDTPSLISEEGALFRGVCTMPETLPPAFFEPKESKLKKALNSTLLNFWSTTGFSGPQSEAEREAEAAAAKANRKKVAVAIGIAAGLLLLLPAAWFVVKAKSEMGAGMVSRYIYETFANDDPQKLLPLGDAYFNEERWGRAAAVYQRVKELSTPAPEMVKRLAAALERSGDTVDAAEVYFEYLKQDPKDDEIIGKLKQLYDAGKETGKMIALYELLVEQRTDLEDAPAALFALYSGNGNAEQALDLYRDKIAKNPRTFEDLMEIGRLQKALGRVNESIATFGEAVASGRGTKDAYHELAYAYHKAGLEDKAMEYFNIYVRLDPQGAEAINNAGYLNLAQGKTEKAMELFQQALGADQGNIRSYLGLAITYSRLGDAPKAEDFCKKILAVDADYSPALNRLAWLYAQQKRKLDEAQNYSIASMRYNENVPDYIDTLSEIYYQRQDYDKAIALIEKAIKLRSYNPYFRTQLEKFKAAKKQADSVN